VTTETQPTDVDLCADLANGDRVAFARLFDRHVRAVANHCFRLSGSWPAVEDLTQATFLIAWRRRQDIRVVAGSALPWLLTVATNNVRTERRTQRRWLAALRRIPVVADTADPADDVAGRVDDQRRMRPILAAVRRLPRAEREAIALCVWAGLSYADAAQALGIGEVSVRSRVSRARARLARLVGEDEHGQEER
jgi:RNA polymerase sigma-70 factor (ECF subfamily)